MKTAKLFVGLATTLCAAFGVASAARADEPIDPLLQYKVILDRAPFGLAQGSGSATAPPALQRYRLVAVVSDNITGQLMASIFDSERTRVYLRAEGETFEGVKVVKLERPLANEKGAAMMAKVTLQQGLDVATLEYQPRTAPAGVMPVTALPNPVTGGVVTMPPPPTVSPVPGQAVPVPRRIPFRRGEEK